jgi:hypothetical protein
MALRPTIPRTASLLGRPVMQWGPEWVVGSGVEQFRRSVLGEAG